MKVSEDDKLREEKEEYESRIKGDEDVLREIKESEA